MKLNVMQLGMIGTNCYIFWEEGDNRCGIVDPGDSGEKVAAYLQEQGLEPQAILLTHCHFDHILGIPGLRKQWPQLPVWCHPADVDESQSSIRMFGATFPSVSSFGNLHYYREGDRVSVGPITLEVLETPGHTPGSVTLKAENVLFTGDTLFQGSIGRTDFEGGSYEQIMRSLKKLGSLPGDYRVCPGHEGLSTLNEERRSNYYMLQAMAD